MKKCISILLFMLLFVGTVLPASAQLPITVSAAYDSVTDSITVSGTVESLRGMIPLTLTITDPDGDFVAAAQTVAKKDANGVVRYAFEPIQLSYMAVGGDYTLEISGHFVDGIKPAVLQVPGADSLLTQLKAFVASENPYGAVLANADTFGADETALEALREKAQSVYNAAVAAKTYTLPDSIETEEDAKLVKEIKQKIVADLAEILEIAKFSNITAKGELLSWLDEHYTAYGFDTDSEVTAESEEALTEYVELVKENAEFLQRLMKKDNLLTREDIQKALYEEALLTTISKQKDYQIINAVKTFTSFFPVGRMTETQLVTRCEAISGKYYDSCEEVTTALTASTDSGSSSGKTGSGGWGSSKGDSLYLPTVTEPAPAQQSGFSDLAGYSWAQEAIAALSGQGVIAGRDARSFAPGETVTRAEMIKILLLATGKAPEANAESGFLDVAPEAWYAPYIAAARKLGLAQGTEDGYFMPEAQVTRQDLAVLLYRAFSMTEGGETLAFADGDSVAGYAETAVSFLVEKGIIQGVGDNQFAPLASATRAQAALMVYRAQQAQ
ncbi:MAG: S-layer homology domain-containing protein [Clostridia bacterium]|nr:S-layer homology domain-containing protein [Clostridia bacterium]